MIHKAKELSPDQRLAIESLLGRSIGENEEIIIRSTDSPSAPEAFRPDTSLTCPSLRMPDRGPTNERESGPLHDPDYAPSLSCNHT